MSELITSELASLESAAGWLNSQPLTAAALRGRVVLVDFWTYSCINWLRTLPYVRAWAERYEAQGLVVVGVHTPEFSFEKDVENVRRATKEMKVDYPVALDPEYAVWRAFDNHYWPALYFIDAQGQIRDSHFGEGAYEKSEKLIQRLLGEAGADGVGRETTPVEPVGFEAPADWDQVRTPETYLGAYRAESFASPDGAVFAERHVYAIPAQLRLNHWALSGDWTIGRESALLNEPDGRIAFRFQARDLHLVMGPAAPGASVRFRVLVDGQAPAASHGLDVDELGNGTVAEPRLYQLIRQQGPVTERTFEIGFLDPGLQAYVFTFG